MRLLLLLCAARVRACVHLGDAGPNGSPLAEILPTGYDDDTLSVSVLINWYNSETLHMQPGYGYGDDVAVSAWVRPSQSRAVPEPHCWGAGEALVLATTTACTGPPVDGGGGPRAAADWRNFTFFVAVNVCYYDGECDAAAAAPYLDGTHDYKYATDTPFGECRRYWAYQFVAADIGAPEYIIYNIVSVTPAFSMPLDIRASDVHIKTTITLALPVDVQPDEIAAAAVAMKAAAKEAATPNAVVVVVVEAEVAGRVDVPPDLPPAEKAVLLTSIEDQACAAATGECSVEWTTSRRRRRLAEFTGEYTVTIELPAAAPTLPEIVIVAEVLTAALATSGSVLQIEEVTLAVEEAVVSIEVVMIQSTEVVLSDAVESALVADVAEAAGIDEEELAVETVFEAVVAPPAVVATVAETNPLPFAAAIGVVILMMIWFAFGL